MTVMFLLVLVLYIYSKAAKYSTQQNYKLVTFNEYIRKIIIKEIYQREN